MDCLVIGNRRHFSHGSIRVESEGISYVSSSISFGKSLIGTVNLASLRRASVNNMESHFSRSSPKWHLHLGKSKSCRMFASSISLCADTSLKDDEASSDGDPISNETCPKLSGQDELKSLLIDSERSRLLQKLSEANQHNRHLKRQLQVKDADLVVLKSDLALLELDLQALVELAKEVANSGDIPGIRMINGKNIHAHLASKLEVANTKLKQHINGVDLLQFQDITLYWIGMAENVQVMGSFDGWSEGEEMSPEYDGTFAKFSATLKLRHGSYEIKFLVDGEWQLSPELPTVGEGLMKNNLLTV